MENEGNIKFIKNKEQTVKRIFGATGGIVATDHKKARVVCSEKVPKKTKKIKLVIDHVYQKTEMILTNCTNG